MSGTLWSDEELQQLETLWNMGLTGEQVAARMGTRSARAVQKRARELGLERHRHGGQRFVFGREVKKTVQGPSLALLDLKRRNGEPRPWRLPDGSRVTLDTVAHGQCRWPVHGSGAAMEVCAHPTHKQSSWCRVHWKRCYPMVAE